MQPTAGPLRVFTIKRRANRSAAVVPIRPSRLKNIASTSRSTRRHRAQSQPFHWQPSWIAELVLCVSSRTRNCDGVAVAGAYQRRSIRRKCNRRYSSSICSPSFCCCRRASWSNSRSPAKALNGCASPLSYRFSISTKCVGAFGIWRMLAGLNHFISYYDHSAAKWRLWFDWKERAQDRECLRCKHKENEYKHCCEFHARRLYQKSIAFHHSSPRFVGSSSQNSSGAGKILTLSRVGSTIENSRRRWLSGKALIFLGLANPRLTNRGFCVGTPTLLRVVDCVF